MGNGSSSDVKNVFLGGRLEFVDLTRIGSAVTLRVFHNSLLHKVSNETQLLEMGAHKIPEKLLIQQ